MKTITIRLDEETAKTTETIARKRGSSVDETYSEAILSAVTRYKRQRALTRIDEEVVGTGATVSREEFEEAQAKLRGKGTGWK